MKSEIIEIVTVLLTLIGTPDLDLEIRYWENDQKGSMASYVIFKDQEPTDPHTIVIFTDNWNGLSLKDKRSILLHELAHVTTAARGHSTFGNVRHGRDFRKTCRDIKDLVQGSLDLNYNTCKES